MIDDLSNNGIALIRTVASSRAASARRDNPLVETGGRQDRLAIRQVFRRVHRGSHIDATPLA